VQNRTRHDKEIEMIVFNLKSCKATIPVACQCRILLPLIPVL